MPVAGQTWLLVLALSWVSKGIGIFEELAGCASVSHPQTEIALPCCALTLEKKPGLLGSESKRGPSNEDTGLWVQVLPLVMGQPLPHCDSDTIPGPCDFSFPPNVRQLGRSKLVLVSLH